VAEKACWDLTNRDGGHEELISNGGRFKPALAERDKKHTMIDLRRISTSMPSIGLSRPREKLGLVWKILRKLTKLPMSDYLYLLFSLLFMGVSSASVRERGRGRTSSVEVTEHGVKSLPSCLHLLHNPLFLNMFNRFVQVWFLNQ
jgi:hypothetical protein